MSTRSGPGRTPAVARLQVVLAAVVALLLTLVVLPLLPVLVAGEAPTSVAVTVVAVALTALLGGGRPGWAGVHRGPVAARPRSADVPLDLTGRVTDPGHHPVRPRAPGPA
ncbi:hypothetical protein [Nocardioides sp. AX2bis]|uniref:hypothetical protein n=1 Tax=Nocardioides sp. AX2bis TaxID=2653157 RepID=UPI0012F21BF2|nr:hypothetical protein [Nocardioides sp. AX2bis]VXC49206.1 conserved hypothetical protein [Nocardioides sp. AX2bis]